MTNAPLRFLRRRRRTVTPSARSAGVYVLVITSAMLVTLLGLSGLLMIQTQRRGQIDSEHYLRARLAARSSVEWIVEILDQTPDWREGTLAGAWLTNYTIGETVVTISADDPIDGDFSDSADDPVQLEVDVTSGNARYRVAVELEPFGAPGLRLLENAAFAHERILNYAQTEVDAALRTNDSITNMNTIAGGSVIAAGAIHNFGTIEGGWQTGAAQRDLPSAKVFELFAEQATKIRLNQLKYRSGVYILEDQVLSPNSAPSTTNPTGLYYIDCAGQPVNIRNVRIVGSLMLLNASATVATADGLNWAPADLRYPALLVDGHLSLGHNTGLDEDELDVNFNPPGSPYHGEEDKDIDDNYTNSFNGLIYVSGDCTTANTIRIEGALIVGGELITIGRLQIEHDDTYVHEPPAGFEANQRRLRPERGSWKRIID